MTKRNINVNIKLLTPESKVPTQAYDGSVGFDLTARSFEIDKYRNIVYHTGISVEIPKGYFGMIMPKSRNTKKNLVLLNSPGIIDSDYRGEITVKYRPTIHALHFKRFIDWFRFMIKGKPAINCNLDYHSVDISGDKNPERDYYIVGEDIAQLIILPYPNVQFTEVKELNTTERGDKGYGSTPSDR